MANNDPTALKFFGVRFTAPVKPGDALETQVWEVGPGPNGTTEVTFVTKNLATGKVSVQFVLTSSESLISFMKGCIGRRDCVHQEGGKGEIMS